MLKIGLSGGIGSGKSTVAQALAELGALVVDSDKIAREVVEPGTPGLAALLAQFGPEVLAADGTLDRPKLAAKAFADDESRQKLNAITHPLVAARAQDLAETALPEQILVRDIPLLVEMNFAPFFHLAVIVDAPLEERLRRLTAVRGMAREDALARIKAQATEEQRRAAADVWLDNSGTPEQLRERVRELWAGRLAPFNENLLRDIRPRGRYELVPYDPTWPAQAQRLINRIKIAADTAPSGGKGAIRVDHIGSTAVPGLASKDVIDLQLTVASLDVADELAKPLADAGFPRNGRITHDNAHDGSEQWDKRIHGSADPGRPAILHLRVDSWPNQRFALVFRDWLRANSDIAKEYVQLKQQAVERTNEVEDPADSYYAVKEPWFAQSYRRAWQWAGATGWKPGAQ